MSNVQAMRGGESVSPPAADEAEIIATEFLRNHPDGALRVQTGLAVLAVLLVGGADWLAVFHVMALKFVDAMGQPIGDTAGLAAMSGVTLIGYVLIGTAWGCPQRSARMVAVGLYAVVLVLLGLAIAPAEVSNIREVWAGITGGGVFGANGADDAPVWFVWPCLAILSVAFSLFGLVFLVAKDWLWRLVGLWQARACARMTLQRIAESREAGDQRRQLASFIALLETPATQDALWQAALRQGIEAYRAGVEAQAAALKDALSDLRTPKADRQRLAVLLAEAGACLKSLPSSA